MFKTMVKTKITIQKVLEINKLKSIYVSYIACEGNAPPPPQKKKKKVNVYSCYSLQMQNRMPNVNTSTQSMAVYERNYYFYNRRRLSRSKGCSIA